MSIFTDFYWKFFCEILSIKKCWANWPNAVRDRVNIRRRRESSVSPLYCYVYLENIGFVYPGMSMVVISP
jgi:hypothetical protein